MSKTIQDKCGTDRRDIRLTKENPETGAIGIRSQKRRKVPEGAWIKYRLAFESTSDGIFTIDCNFNISSITPSVERQLGYKIEEVINRPIQDLNILTSESLSRAVSDVIKVFQA